MKQAPRSSQWQLLKFRLVKARWQLLSAETSTIESLSDKLGIDPLLARLLVNRQIVDPETAWQFLNPRLEDLHDPFLMKGMKECIRRLFQAIERKEKILVYGDYDVDGITATAVLKRALEMLGASVGHYIPKRLEEGYGLKSEVIEEAVREGYSLVVSVDSGIRAFEVGEKAHDLGVDLIVTDHHLPSDKLPRAYAILNPKQVDCPYPDKNLAAVGVVFKIVQALFKEAGRSHVVHHFLKMVAIGTVADMVPLTGENRIIVSHGLAALARPHNPGLQALLQGVGIGRDVNHVDIAFKLAPRINAFTRMGGGAEVIDLFAVDDLQRAHSIVGEMNARNVERRSEEDSILAEIEERYQQMPEDFAGHFIVAAGEDWHCGVIGNVASRLVQRFHRPVLVLSIGSDKVQGSGRSIPNFHLLEALESCSDLFATYGGHAQAVGCTLKPEYAGKEAIKNLADRLDQYAATCLTASDLVPAISIDSVLPVEKLSLDFYREIDRLAPFGIGNPVPVFSSLAVTVADGPWVLKEKHLKFKARCNGSALDAIWWRRGNRATEICAGGQLDLAYSLSRDIFRGREKLHLTIRDMRPSEEKASSP